MRFLLLAILVGHAAQAQNGATKIYLKTGEVVSTSYARLDNNSPGDSFVVTHAKNGEKVFITHIDSILAPGVPGKTRCYIPVESYRGVIWGERTYRSQNLTLYYTDVGMAAGDARYKAKHFQYVKDNGPLSYLTRNNLQQDFADNSASIEHVRKGHSIGKIQAILWALGGTMAVGSLVYEASSFDAVDGNVPVTLFAGIGIFVIPWFMNPARYDHYLDAAKTYKPATRADNTPGLQATPN